MSTSLNQRLNQILPRIIDPEFLSSEGIGNEIACYIFDYAPEKELEVREYLVVLRSALEKRHAHRVVHLDLLDVITEYLTSRSLLDKAIEMQATKSDAELLRALKGPLAAEKIRDFIAERYAPAEADLLLVSGVGSAWPMLRAHGLLNCLHTVMGNTPLVMFYPGTFDGTTLRLFGRISTSTTAPGKTPYYRAFLLVPGHSQA